MGKKANMKIYELNSMGYAPIESMFTLSLH